MIKNDLFCYLKILNNRTVLIGIQTSFSSSDLELISGIKTATIRMWERRYNLFSPDIKNRNIRAYSMEDLKKILNIAYLNRNGVKISKLAAMDERTIKSMVQDIGGGEEIPEKAKLQLKLAMYSFDADLFFKTFRDLRKENEFDWICENCFMPFLHFIGLLWQTDALRPSHEHFMSNLIVQQILLETYKLKAVQASEKVYVLCLWEQEIHEIGLLYLQYKLRKRGFKVVYLGRSLAVEDVLYVYQQFPCAVVVQHFTITPNTKDFNNYVEDLFRDKGTNLRAWFLGRIDLKSLRNKPLGLRVAESIPEFLELLP